MLESETKSFIDGSVIRVYRYIYTEVFSFNLIPGILTRTRPAGQSFHIPSRIGSGRKMLTHQYPCANTLNMVFRRIWSISAQLLCRRRSRREADDHRWKWVGEQSDKIQHFCRRKQILRPQFSCHTDHLLLGDPTYVEALNMAYRESFVFKFADRVAVRFQCEIRLCLKDEGGCEGITVGQYLRTSNRSRLLLGVEDLALLLEAYCSMNNDVDS